MKTLKQNIILTTVIFLLLISCQKDIDTNKTISAHNDEAQTDYLLRCNNCLVTHTEDNVFGHVIDFFYNKRGNPDSLNFDGTPITIQYDKWGRLIKETFGTWAWNEFKYKGGSLLPYAYYDYYPDFGGLIGIDSFQYNIKGEMTTRIGTNILLPDYNYIEHYAYNTRGNVVKVDIAAHNGGTVFDPGYTEYLTSKYDNNPNFITGSTWTRFLMFNTGYEGFPFFWMLFSRNNAETYEWIQDSAGDELLFSSTFEYDDDGFADSINMDIRDNLGNDYGIFTRASSSTCDNFFANSFKLPQIKSLVLQKRLLQLNRGMPNVIQKTTRL